MFSKLHKLGVQSSDVAELGGAEFGKVGLQRVSTCLKDQNKVS